MAKVKSSSEPTSTRKRRPALTPESQEAQCIGLAVDLAAKQLAEGTASSQVITHYLKLATTKARLEQEILEKQRDLYVAKTEALQTAKQSEELYANAIRAMKGYAGHEDFDDED